MSLRERFAAAKAAADRRAWETFMASKRSYPYSSRCEPIAKNGTEGINSKNQSPLLGVKKGHLRMNCESDITNEQKDWMKRGWEALEKENYFTSVEQLNALQSDEDYDLQASRDLANQETQSLKNKDSLDTQVSTPVIANIPQNRIKVINLSQYHKATTHDDSFLSPEVGAIDDWAHSPPDNTAIQTQIQPCLSSGDIEGPSRLTHKYGHHAHNKGKPIPLSQKSLAALRLSTRKRYHPTDSWQLDKQGRTKEPKIMPRPQSSRGNLQFLNYFKTLIEDYEQSVLNSRVNFPDPMNERAKVYEYLHRMLFADFITDELVSQTGILGNSGLGRIIDDPMFAFPPQIQEDAKALRQRWHEGRYKLDLLEGITTIPTNRETGTRLHRVIWGDFPFLTGADYIGPGMLSVGDWWPYQICAVRDGAHGEIEAGISGDNQQGAYSIVLSGGKYANKDHLDIDDGETIQYCGTPGTVNEISKGTKQLLISFKDKNPVRVLRSHTLPKTNKYRPLRGIRYDGFYNILSYEIIDSTISMHRFKMARSFDQCPMRHSGDYERPTNRELLEFQNLTFYIN